MAQENAHNIILSRKMQNAKLYDTGVDTHTHTVKRDYNTKISVAMVYGQKKHLVYIPNFQIFYSEYTVFLIRNGE